MFSGAHDERWVIGWLVDEGGRCMYVDKQWTKVTGQEIGEAVDRGWLLALHPEDRPRTAEGLADSFNRQDAFRREFRLQRRDGAHRWALAVGAPRFEDRQFRGYVGSIVDIHRSRTARDALLKSEEKLRLALAAAEMGTFVWHIEDGRCERDAGMLRLFGKPLGSSLSLNSAIERDLHPEDRSRFADALRRACDPAGDGRMREDVRAQRADGRLRWLQISAQVHFSAQPRRPRRLVGTAIDVTARERAKDAIRSSEERLAVAHERLTAALRASPVVAFEMDRDLRYVWIQNPQHGIRSEDVVGRTVAEIFEREEDARPIMEIKRRVLDTGVPAREEVHIQLNGVLRWFDLIVEPRRSGAEIVGLLCTATDITEHKRSEDALKEADRRKDSFLAVLGHEIRNPLASIQNSVQTLMSGRGLVDSATADKAVDIMARQVRHLGRLVDDLLDVSRINRDKIELRREPVDIGLALREALETTRPQAEDKRVRLEISLPAEPLIVIGDATRIAQIVTNLVGNAIKYTDASGSVRVRVESDDGDAVVTVADDGIGIAPQVLPRVFDLFMQADSAPLSGLGIGLALSKKLVELHGGAIEARSPGPGSGSVFTVRLPLTRSEARARAEATADAGGMAPEVKVLVVDDNRDVADSFAMLLSGFGVPVQVAYDGESGVEAAAAFGPDIAFIDIRMPGVDGYETARRIAALRSRQHPILVALSGLGQEQDQELSRAAGLDLHLIKPVTVEAIRQVIALREAQTLPAAR